MDAALAHSVTAARLLAAPALALAVWRGWFVIALSLITFAAVSDLLDGWLARRIGAASEVGRWFDHLADIAFLLAGFATLAALGEVSAVVPLAIGGAFAFYVADSLRRSPNGSLIASRLGHIGGVLNYVVLVVVIVDLATAGGMVTDAARAAAVAAVPLYSLAAVIARLLTSQPSGPTG